MTLATLAIHTESWLQEELGAQRALLLALEKIDAAARAGSGAGIESGTRDLAELVALAGPREARRHALLARLAGELGLPLAQLTLTKVAQRLDAAALETTRLAGLRTELREVAARVLKAGRALAAVARYHRGLLTEICELFLSQAPEGERHLLDARA